MNIIRTFMVVCVSVLLSVQVSAQTASKKRVTDTRKDLQTEVRFLLISLASDASTFRDQILRARCLGRIADLLWTIDTDQGKRLFRSAWEAAEKADQLNTPFNLGEAPPNLRHEILKLAAKRDRSLTEEFLKKLQTPDEADDSATKANKSEDALNQTLLLASELLRGGDTKRALEFAEPVLGNVSVGTIEFLTNLRAKEPAVADSHYGALLRGSHSGMDADTVSLLSSYLFTPHVYIRFNSEGPADRLWYATSPPGPADVEPQVRLAFFQTATEVLLRDPQQPTSNAYTTLRHFLPLFEAYGPAELTQAMRAKLAELESSTRDTASENQTESMPQGDKSDSASTEREKTLLEQVDRAKTSAERDELYFRLALLLLNKDDIKARDYVSKIDESWFRQQAQSWVDTGLAVNAVKKKRIDVALQLTRDGALSSIQKIWIFTQGAELMAKSDREKALSLLDNAMIEARRIGNSEIDRPRGLFAIAHAVRLLDPSRTREAIFDAVKAANSTEGFTGEGGVLTLSVTGKNQILNNTFAVPEFDIAGIFEEMARSDYETAVQLARGFQADAPRANATIAISRSVLSNLNERRRTK